MKFLIFLTMLLVTIYFVMLAYGRFNNERSVQH